MIKDREYDNSGDEKHLSDNSFEDKERFGQGDDYFGVRSNSKLHEMRGANFSKEKKKIKDSETNNAQVGFDTAAINSVKF